MVCIHALCYNNDAKLAHVQRLPCLLQMEKLFGIYTTSNIILPISRGLFFASERGRKPNLTRKDLCTV